MTADTTAPALLGAVGLMPDGPGQWGKPVPAPGPGVFIVELPAPLPSAPIELTRVGKWIERVGSLRLDGQRPSSKALAARLAAFWLPSQTVLYVGASETSVRRRLAAIAATELGDRRPHPGGHWLKVLGHLEGARIWWAETTATEEYEDALLDAFAEGVGEAERAVLPDSTVVLPFANLRSESGGRKATGLTGSLLAEAVEAPAPPTRVVVLPDGDAEGARGEPAPPHQRGTATKTSASGSARAGASAATPARAGTRAPASLASASPAATRRSVAAATRDRLAAEAAAAAGQGAFELTVDGAARLRAELEDLTRLRRPEVVARIRTAKEHGDLSENAEYHAAREEQSFLEGRIQAIEARLRSAVIVDAPASGSRVGLGSKVTVEHGGETAVYTIVGASESHPASGRISSSSPVGKALVGRDVGDEVIVRTPAGERTYRIVAID